MNNEKYFLNWLAINDKFISKKLHPKFLNSSPCMQTLLRLLIPKLIAYLGRFRLCIHCLTLNNVSYLKTLCCSITLSVTQAAWVFSWKQTKIIQIAIFIQMTLLRWVHDLTNFFARLTSLGLFRKKNWPTITNREFSFFFLKKCFFCATRDQMSKKKMS